jgi:hypothetical protein
MSSSSSDTLRHVRGVVATAEMVLVRRSRRILTHYLRTKPLSIKRAGVDRPRIPGHKALVLRFP